MAVPYIFGNLTSPLPIPDLDANFATPITFGATPVLLGDTLTALSGFTSIDATTFDGTTFDGTTFNGTTFNGTNFIGTNFTLSGGTANGVLYLNGSKLVSSGSGLVFDGTSLGVGTSSPSQKLTVAVADTSQATQWRATTGYVRLRPYQDSTNGAILDATNTAETTYSPLTLTGSVLRLFGNNATGITIDGSGNAGLGVTPSAWNSGKAFQLYSTTSLFNDGTDTYFGNNFYYSTGWKYLTTSAAMQYQQGSGGHKWFTAPSGTAGNAITFTQAMTLDASGNLGLGVTPSAWDSSYKALQISAGGVFASATGGYAAYIGNNAYYNSGWKYMASTGSSMYYNQTGNHYWLTAPSGTAGNTISFTQAMTLDASGNLGIGTASPGGSSTDRQLTVQGTTAQISTKNGTFATNLGTTATLAYVEATGANPLAFYTNSTERARISAAGGFMVGTITDPGAGLISDSKGDVRSIPQNAQTSAYVLVVGDAGKHISITTGGVTCNASIFSAGQAVTIYNNSGSSQTITAGASVTFRLAGTATTGNRTLAQYGVATLLCVTGGATPTFVVSGAGVT